MTGEGMTNGNKLIFALDIGTRSVIGVVGTCDQEYFKVMRVETVEHTRRAVVDGQIEDIEQTARIAGIVKERLEEGLGVTLDQVHVAAAGRILRTRRVIYEMDLDSRRPMDSRQVFRLESEAIQSAYDALLAENSDAADLNYYCVGHSVIRYTLDGYAFSTLDGHRGRRACVELIATFLPGEVVESLYTTMQRIGLTVASLTLEPIAAISAVIPQELRLLNVVLVDVGAGTSDIAVASGGSVVAYTMATVAGDEITERIMHEILVDFQVAEQVKFDLSAGNELIRYTDILGIESEITSHQLTERIRPAVEQLAQTIAERILEVNGKPPMAVFMVGGGSRTPGLCPLVAQHVGLAEGKVAIGGSNYMKRLLEAESPYLSPEYATPMGIAVTAASASVKEGFSVWLNGKPVNIQSSANSTVMEILLRSGYQYNQIMGRVGRSITFELNGERTTIRGGMPTLAEILVNGQPAGITTTLDTDDVISFEPAVNGVDAECRVDLLVGEYRPFTVLIDGEAKPAGTVVRVNGMPAVEGHIIRNMDKVVVSKIFTLEDLLRHTEYGARHGKVYINGNSDMPLDTKLAPGDQIVFLIESPPKSAPKSAASEPEAEKNVNAQEPEIVHEPPLAPPVDDTPAPEPEAAPEPMQSEENYSSYDDMNAKTYDDLYNELGRLQDYDDYDDDYGSHRDEYASYESQAPARAGRPPEPVVAGRPISVVLNGRHTTLKPKPDGSDFFFFDVLSYTDIDPSNPQGDIVILKNGRNASYIEAIRDGDEISIYWKNTGPT